MMSLCHFCLRLLIALYAVSVASTNGSSSVPPSQTMNTSTTAAPTTTPIPAASNSTESAAGSATTMNVSAVTSTVQVATTASTPTQFTTTIAADGMNTTAASNTSMTTANATTTLPNTTGSVPGTQDGNTTMPSPSQGTATTAPLNTTAGPQGNMTTSPNSTAGPQGNMTTAPNSTAGPQGNMTASPNSTAGPQGTTTMHTSPASPQMTSMTGAPGSTVPTSPSIAVTNSTFTPQTESPTTTTTTQTPTTTAISMVSTLAPNMAGLFVLSLTVGSNSNITCAATCDAEDIKNLTTEAFRGKAGFYDVRIVPMTNRRKRDVTPVRVMLEVRFIARSLLELHKDNVSQMIISALQQMNETGSVTIKADVMKIIAEDFALTSRNLCQAVGVCDLGYVCLVRGERAACYHLCHEDSTWSCGEHGTCQVHVMDGQAHRTCKCDSDYDNVWSGDKCQDSEISGEKKARIAGGVLGAFCGVFIIIIIVLLVRRGGCCGGSSSQKTYQMGVSNAGYTDISMQKM